MNAKPVLFLDIDGVINSYPEPKARMIKTFGEYKRYNFGPMRDGNIYPVWWSPRVVDFLNGLNRDGLCEIVWLTTWVDEAVSVFAPRVGLDEFPVITNMEGTEFHWEPSWWKARRVKDFLGDNEEQRRVVWLDDDLSRGVKDDFRYRYDRDGDRSLLITVQSCPGLRPQDMDRIQAFLEGDQ